MTSAIEGLTPALVWKYFAEILPNSPVFQAGGRRLPVHRRHRNAARTRRQTGPLRESRTLLNLDSEEEGALYVGGAGGQDTIGTWSVGYQPAPAALAPLEVTVSGLRGGHSGLEIDIDTVPRFWEFLLALLRNVQTPSGTNH